MTKTRVLLAASLTSLVACAAKPAPTVAAAPAEARPATMEPTATPPTVDDGAAAEIIAQIDHALEAWRDSCSTPNEQGLCLELAPADHSALRCAQPVLGRVVVHPRHPELASSAQAELAAALDRVICEDAEGCRPELRVQPADPALLEDFHRALAAGRLARADAELEAYFGITMPDDIDFFVEEWKRDSPEPGHAEQYRAQLAKKNDSERRFESFFDAKAQKHAWLVSNLAAVKAHRDREVVMRAALRTSWTALHFYDELHAAEVPPSLRGKPQRDIYCQALDEVGTRARDQAKEAAHYCTMRAAQYDFRSPTVSMCQELLAQLDPPS